MTAKRRETPQFPVSRRALLARINRKLVDDEQQVCITRPDGRARIDLGEYYVRGPVGIDVMNIDLEGFGRELGVLRPHEKLAED